MKPFTRELISDRRQPVLRWSAVFAGVAVAVALWSVLQMLGMGIGLSSIDVDDAGSVRHVRIGNSVWSMLAPLIALAIGGVVAGRLASTVEQRVGATHGFIVGAFASVIGLILTVSIVSMLAGSSVKSATSRFLTTDNVIVTPSLRNAERNAAAKEMGKILFGAGAALLVGIGAAVAGGALAVKPLRRRKHDTEEVPVVPPPAAPPADAPHVA
jgi:MFS family permease